MNQKPVLIIQFAPARFNSTDCDMRNLGERSKRRRIRLIPMASELGISERKIRQLLLLGMPHTQVQGVIWFEPSRVHGWLDKFNRTSRAPGIKRTRGMKLAQVTETKEDAGK
jgi:hypothetical protein